MEDGECFTTFDYPASIVVSFADSSVSRLDCQKIHSVSPSFFHLKKNVTEEYNKV